VLVAGGRVVGAAERVAAAGEWRTNVSVGGSLRSLRPTDEAAELAQTAAAVASADFVGVDLLPVEGEAGYVVLELNGAVDFDGRYSLDGRDVSADIATAPQL
jgi:glutathione synthase/RimK-type ligase-like ATP-grasp enzyme